MAQEVDSERGRSGGHKPRRRVWAQDVEVSAMALRTKLKAIRAARGNLGPVQQEIYDGVEHFLRAAADASNRMDPIPRSVSNWWRGTLIEAAYLNLHAAEAAIVPLLDDAQVNAEIPEAVARMCAGLHRDDQRLELAKRLTPKSVAPADPSGVGGAGAASAPVQGPGHPAVDGSKSDQHGPADDERRALLQKAVQIGYAASDQQHSRVRNFRNVVIVTAMFVTVFVSAFVAVVSANPHTVPFCFEPTEGLELYCPTNGGVLNTAFDVSAADTAVGAQLPAADVRAAAIPVPGPSEWDVIVVALLGLVGGALAAAVSIRNIRGTSTPYSLPAALALLKLPLGALTALGGLIFIGGDFIPGLSSLDSQGQILAYALLFGYGQQLLTRLIDNQADSILSTVPSKNPAAAPANAPPLASAAT